MKKFLQIIFAFCLFIFPTAIFGGERVSFNDDWQFQKDDPKGAEGKIA